MPGYLFKRLKTLVKSAYPLALSHGETLVFPGSDGSRTQEKREEREAEDRGHKVAVSGGSKGAAGRHAGS